ncbi:MAG TPA: DJ-1/PfpI family protein [Bacteroidota bacterium]
MKILGWSIPKNIEVFEQFNNQQQGRIHVHNSLDTFPGAILRRSFVFLLFVATVLVATCANAGVGRYVCSPCGLPCDAKFFDNPGTCPDCGMPLISEAEAKVRAEAKALVESKKIAILIFNGVEVIDFTGPYEVFGAANFDVYTVARTKDPITTAMGLTVVPKYSFDDAPKATVLVVPGGGVKAAQDDAATLKWIIEETARCEHTMSVCNGAFILAHAGLLDGLSATTTNGNIPRLRDQFPKIRVVDDQRFVDNGKIITTAGLSAGIDGALHVVELLMGRGYAQQVALIEEYDFSERAGFVRAAMADKLIPDMNPGADFGKWDVVSTEGGTDHWQRILRGTSNKTAGELAEYIESTLSSAAHWTMVKGGTGGRSEWKFKGKKGEMWNGIVTVEETSGRNNQFTVVVKIAKA